MLQHQLAPPEETPDTDNDPNNPFASTPVSGSPPKKKSRPQKFFVRSGTRWQRSWSLRSNRAGPHEHGGTATANGLGDDSSTNQSTESMSMSLTTSTSDDTSLASANMDVMNRLLDAKHAMQALWGDERVRSMMRRRKVRLEDSAPLYVPPFLPFLPCGGLIDG